MGKALDSARMSIHEIRDSGLVPTMLSVMTPCRLTLAMCLQPVHVQSHRLGCLCLASDISQVTQVPIRTSQRMLRLHTSCPVLSRIADEQSSPVAHGSSAKARLLFISVEAHLQSARGSSRD